MNRFIIYFTFSILISCQGNPLKTTKINRSEILGRDFSNSDVISVELIEIGHPMLGGIIKTIKLNKSQKIKFLTDFDNLKKKGVLKCGPKYVIRLNMKNDTLRLKACGNNIANRVNDFYYESENSKNIIQEYLPSK